MYGVYFRTNDFTFVDYDEFVTDELKSLKATFDGTGELAEVGAEVALGGTPLASWVLARLTGLSESSLFPAESVRREGEMGGFRIRLLAVRGTELVAKLRFAAERGVAELTATAADPETAADAARDMVSVLRTDPGILGRCKVAVRAQELGGHRNEYGYDGAGFLGQFNVYE